MLRPRRFSTKFWISAEIGCLPQKNRFFQHRRGPQRPQRSGKIGRYRFAKCGRYASVYNMKAPFTLLCLLVCSSILAAAPAIELGQSEESVLENLGKPMGTIGLRDKTLLLYPQGEVTIEEGKVSQIDLMDPEEFAADQERLAREREEWLAEQERLKAIHVQEGEALKSEKLQSRAFAALPAKDRVDYWRTFQIRYPTIDVSEQIAGALESYEVELAELRSQQRIAELEARVAKAEQEAATARLETEQLREETEEAKRKSRFYGLRYYTEYPSNHRYYYRPPTITIYDSNTGTVTRHNSCNDSLADRVSNTLKIVRTE